MKKIPIYVYIYIYWVGFHPLCNLNNQGAHLFRNQSSDCFVVFSRQRGKFRKCHCYWGIFQTGKIPKCWGTQPQLRRGLSLLSFGDPKIITNRDLGLQLWDPGRGDNFGASWIFWIPIDDRAAHSEIKHSKVTRDTIHGDPPSKPV